MEGQTLRFVSWNVHGVATKIGSKPKFDYVSEELIRQRAEIVFLQETHIGPKNYALLKDPAGFSDSFFTVYDSESKGVAIMIRKNDLDFQYICHDEDYSGGYIVLFCYLYNELFTLVNVYNHKHDREILNRLQNYLRKTAEGVLLIGGDFNTVMDLTLDRKSKSLKHTHTPLRDMFEKFTASLNLMDAWVHLYPTDQVFTRSQNESLSRLDMFLMPEDILERVSDVKICKAEMVPKSKGKTKMRKISDHDLLVLSLTLSKCSTKKKTHIVSMLEEYTYFKDERAGMINGAEILSVINSMTDSNQQYIDGISIQSYKIYQCSYSEVLKTYFNNLLYCKEIPDHFQMSICVTGTRKIFNVDYLIFTMILAKRLSMLLLLHPETKEQPNTDCYLVTFSAKPVRIKWIVLKKILTYLGEIWKETKTGKHQPLADFRILETLGFTEDFQIFDNILPKVSSTSDEFRDDFRELQEGCPLARSIHSLVLKYLQIRINSYRGYEAHICYFRQVVVICKKIKMFSSPKKLSLWKQFENGTELRIVKIVKR